MNAPSSAIPASSGTSTPAWPIPPSSERFDRPSRIPASAGASRTSPVTSRRARPAPGDGRSAGSSRQASTSPTAITGTLTRNSQRQLSQLRITPPMTGPRIGPERQRQADRGDQVAAGAPARGPDGQGLHQREDQAGGEALHDPEADQAGVVPGQCAQDRSGDEEHQRGHPDTFAAPPALRPSGDRDRDRHCQQVAGRYPLDSAVRGVQPDHQRVQRDGDHRRVQDRRDPADDQRQQGVPDLRSQLRRVICAFNRRRGHCDLQLLC